MRAAYYVPSPWLDPIRDPKTREPYPCHRSGVIEWRDKTVRGSREEGKLHNVFEAEPWMAKRFYLGL